MAKVCKNVWKEHDKTYPVTAKLEKIKNWLQYNELLVKNKQTTTIIAIGYLIIAKLFTVGTCSQLVVSIFQRSSKK